MALYQINPGYDLINAMGVSLMMLGFFPLGYRTLRGAFDNDERRISLSASEATAR